MMRRLIDHRGHGWLVRSALALTFAGGTLRGATLSRFHPGGDEGVFVQGVKPEFLVRLEGKETSASVAVTVRELAGAVVHRQTSSMPVGCDHVFQLPTPKRNGYYLVDAELGGRKLQASYVSTPLPVRRDPFFVTRPADWSAPGLFRAYRTLGFGGLQVNCGSFTRWYRHPLDQEKARAGMLKSAYFGRVERMLENPDFVYYGIVLLDPFSIDGPLRIPSVIAERRDQGYYCYPLDYYDCFRLHLETFQKMAAGRIRHWTLSQEIDSAVHDRNRVSHGGPVELASHMVLAGLGYRTLKRNDPGCRVALMSSCGRDYHITRPRFLMTRFILGSLDGAFDLIGLDAYNGNYSLRGGRTRIDPPEDGLRAHILAASELAREYGKDGAVAVDERSFHMPEPERKTPLAGAVAMRLAAYTSRENIIIKSVADVPYFSYLDYAWKSDQVMWKRVSGEDGKVHRSPFPAAMAYATTARILAFARPVCRSEVKLPFGVRGYLFRKEGRMILAIWQTQEKQSTVPLEIKLPCDAVRTDFQGRTGLLRKGENVLELTAMPVFLTLTAAADEIRACLIGARFQGMQPVSGAIRPGDDGGSLLLLVNHLDSAVEVGCPGGRMETLKPHERRVVGLGRLDSKPHQLRVGGALHPVAEMMDMHRVTAACGDLQIDGVLSESSDATPVVLRSPKDIYPRSATIPERALLLQDGKDLEVDLRIMWNRESLYVSTRVRDRAHLNPFRGKDLWRGDSMQLGLVRADEAWSPEMLKRCRVPFNVSVALGQDGVQVYDHGRARVQDWPCMVRREGLYTRYELAIPWSATGLGKPRPGLAFAFNAVVFDLNQAGAKAQHWAAWREGLAGGVDPSKYVTCILEGEPSP